MNDKIKVFTENYKDIKCKTYDDEAKTDSRFIEVRIFDVLQETGIPAHILGYQYLREAIIMVLEYGEIFYYVLKDVYILIAEKYGSTPERVQGAIRHAIEIAWTRNEVDYCYKPTNSRFIKMMVDRLRL